MRLERESTTRAHCRGQGAQNYPGSFKIGDCLVYLFCRRSQNHLAQSDHDDVDIDISRRVYTVRFERTENKLKCVGEVFLVYWCCCCHCLKVELKHVAECVSLSYRVSEVTVNGESLYLFPYHEKSEH
jgi:hypothetical protein